MNKELEIKLKENIYDINYRTLKIVLSGTIEEICLLRREIKKPWNLKVDKREEP